MVAKTFVSLSSIAVGVSENHRIRCIECPTTQVFANLLERTQNFSIGNISALSSTVFETTKLARTKL